MDDVVDTMFEQMADPSYWASFKHGIICPGCREPLTERNGTHLYRGHSDDGLPVYMHCCVDCLINGKAAAA